MSNYTIYYNTRQHMYRELAQRWKAWADGSEVSETQRLGTGLFFRHIGKRFGLIQEFKEIGVI
jgi:hypothetical protein